MTLTEGSAGRESWVLLAFGSQRKIFFEYPPLLHLVPVPELLIQEVNLLKAFLHQAFCFPFLPILMETEFSWAVSQPLPAVVLLQLQLHKLLAAVVV